MFKTALFMIPRKVETTQMCPSFDEWINNMLYIHTVEYYSAV